MFAQQYQRIRVINLPSRTDRRREIRQELRRLGLVGDPRLNFMDAVKPQQAAPWRGIGESGCFQSHLKILREAAVAGESVLILEDDADFTGAAMKTQPSSDVLWGGYTRRPGGRVEGTHCMGFSAAMVKRLVPYLEDLMGTASPPPIDGAYACFLRDNPEVQVNFCSPMVALQRPSPSDIAGRSRIDQITVARPFVALLRKLKRVWRRRSNLQYQTDIQP